MQNLRDQHVVSKVGTDRKNDLRPVGVGYRVREQPLGWSLGGLRVCYDLHSSASVRVVSESRHYP